MSIHVASKQKCHCAPQPLSYTCAFIGVAGGYSGCRSTPRVSFLGLNLGGKLSVHPPPGQEGAGACTPRARTEQFLWAKFRGKL